MSSLGLAALALKQLNLARPPTRLSPPTHTPPGAGLREREVHADAHVREGGARGPGHAPRIIVTHVFPVRMADGRRQHTPRRPDLFHRRGTMTAA